MSLARIHSPVGGSSSSSRSSSSSSSSSRSSSSSKEEEEEEQWVYGTIGATVVYYLEYFQKELSSSS